MNLSFFILLISLVSLLILPSFFELYWQRIVRISLLITIMYAFLNLVKIRHWELRVGSFLALITLCLNILCLEYNNEHIILATIFINIVFHAFIIVELLRFIINSQTVNGNTLSAAACTYLVIGLVWSYIYALIDFYSPGAILSIDSNNVFEYFPQYLYFSFVTITTLGYGDISPTTNIAQNWVVFEAIVGQFYLAILIARLVGLYQPNKIKVKQD
ncbi:potassium channel family protein [Thalassotalea aquiviva]|uniref:potassium channel family protein n=1 Tax=Thalassotalea aquiviva TaxID=3242415 RepID=UPI003529D898